MNNGPFNNTIYYTLYQSYKKDKKYDYCIGVCDKAIENWVYSEKIDLYKWTEYKNKIITK